MSEDRIEMSQRERDRLKIMAPVMSGRRTQREAARLLGVCVRQVRRLQRRLERDGDAAIVHGLRGRPSNRRQPERLRRRVVDACREALAALGPTMACEKLEALGLAVPKETLRRWLLEAGLWQPSRRRDTHRRRRERRECFGELVQADGSEHDWLEGRGERMTLIVFIDDATSRVVARFHPAETTEAYWDVLGRWIRKFGRPLALYTDWDSVFVDNSPGQKGAKTQMGRALGELDIQWIGAGSPQAKGRVERFNGTAQNRLVKELRLAGATTMDEANAVLEKVFLPWFSRHCTVPAASPNDAHRPLGPSMDLAAILCPHERRQVANDYTIRFENRVYQILPPAQSGLRGGGVTVERRADGSLRLRFKNAYLKFKPATRASGALPPNPRSLALPGTPAGGQKKGHAATATRPHAVRPAPGRSGRTPAEPCPPRNTPHPTPKEPYRPGPDHPWRKSLKPQRPDRTFLLGQTTGHF
jgi:transposase